MSRFRSIVMLLVGFALWTNPLLSSCSQGQTTTWDGKHDTSIIKLTVVYFVPADRNPLVDWRDRVDYYCTRIQRFHQREFQGQSRLDVTVHPTPMVSKWTTSELRRGDANAIFFKTLSEIDQRMELGSASDDGFPIVLALSDINHRPLDDFYRLAWKDGRAEFEGILTGGNHFPGSALGGARATYLADRGIGWGLVSADGWRVPYRGSDCVIYHEGLGHTVGLPHPEPGNRSVMSRAQYHGWINESWIDDDQKKRLGWKPTEPKQDPQIELFTQFRARPSPPQPQPGQMAMLKLDVPDAAIVKSLRARFQTAIDGPWIDVDTSTDAGEADPIELGVFDRPTPVSYRVDIETEGGREQLWGYFQVRDADNSPPQPIEFKSDLAKPTMLGPAVIADPPGEELDLLDGLELDRCFKTGKWSHQQQTIQSNKQYGVRLELPYTPPPHYRITVVAEPLDVPNGLLLGLRKGDRRFVVLVNHTSGRDASTALENVDGKNVGNDTTFVGNLFKQNRLSQIVATVHESGVTVTVDGRLVIDWKGSADQLSLSDYWKTPNDRSLFLGTYDCAYCFHRVTVEPL
ncbi:hypothetical protein Mal15_38740 [Stieleria maiorica]|uniref:Uncharacterized protein n=1 Tax=Stieleria maiorica TaxID=2795974 RepID=A0A5B9MLR2_9BACT|nr:hypothetical protein [Stieleria maiorica]QEF99807.1 hypothetical protein Mal15_38740 [Stieleria maiorica]